MDNLIPSEGPQRLTVAETDARVRESLPTSIVTSIRLVTTSLYGENGYEGEFVSSIEMKPDRPVDAVRATLMVLDAACAPADHRTLAKAVAEMAMVMKARAEDGMDTTTRVALIARNLAEFPGDVALAACKRQMDGYKFFPSWMELRMACQIIGGKRLALRAALRKALEAGNG